MASGAPLTDRKLRVAVVGAQPVLARRDLAKGAGETYLIERKWITASLVVRYPALHGW